MAKGRGSLHFQTSYTRERFEEKNYRQIAAPPHYGSICVIFCLRGLAKTNPGRSQHALFRASCVTRCAVTARPFAFVPDKRVRLLHGKGSWQSAFPDQLSKGTLRRKKLQADCRAPFLRFQALCSSGSGGSQRQTQAGHNTPCSALPVSLAVRSLRDPLLLCLIKE